MKMGVGMGMERVSGDGDGKSEVVVYRIRQQKKLLTTVVMMSVKTQAFYGVEYAFPFLAVFAVVRVPLLLVSRLLRCPHRHPLPPHLHRFPHHHQPPY